MPTVSACARVGNCQYRTSHSIPNDNHSDLKRNSSIMISKSYQKFTTFPTGDYSVFFMEDCLSNKDSSDKIIGHSPVGTLWLLRYKICRHRLYTGSVQRLQDYRRVRISSQTANTPILRLRRMCPASWSITRAVTVQVYSTNISGTAFA